MIMSNILQNIHIKLEMLLNLTVYILQLIQYQNKCIMIHMLT